MTLKVFMNSKKGCEYLKMSSFKKIIDFKNAQFITLKI